MPGQAVSGSWLILLTWGAPARNPAEHPEDARPLFRAFPGHQSRRPGCGATTSARSRQGYRALLRPAPTTPNFSLFAPQPSFAEKRMARQKQRVTESWLRDRRCSASRDLPAATGAWAGDGGEGGGRGGAGWVRATRSGTCCRAAALPRRGAGGGLGGRPRGCELWAEPVAARGVIG